MIHLFGLGKHAPGIGTDPGSGQPHRPISLFRANEKEGRWGLESSLEFEGKGAVAEAEKRGIRTGRYAQHLTQRQIVPLSDDGESRSPPLHPSILGKFPVWQPLVGSLIYLGAAGFAVRWVRWFFD